MDKPKGNPLRPQTVLEMLDRAFNIYRANFLAFFGLVAAVTVPITVINLGVTFWMNNQLVRAGFTGNSFRSGNQIDPRAMNSIFSNLILIIGIFLVIAIVVSIIQGVLVNGLLTYMASERTLGRAVTIGEAFNAVKDRLARLGVALVFYYAILTAAGLLLTVLLCLCGLGFGVIGFVSVALYAFLTPVLILERTDLITGMKRAWVLAKARVWPVLGLIGAMAVISYIVSLALTLTGTVFTRGAVEPASFGASQILQIIVQSVVTIFLAPVLPIGLTLLYYDARVRLEGLDIALQAANVPDPRPSDVPSPEPPPGWFMTSDDYKNLGLFMIGGVVVLVIIFGITFLVTGATRLSF